MTDISVTPCPTHNEARVVQAILTSSHPYHRADALAQALKLDLAEVRHILQTSPRVRASLVPLADGEPLYAAKARVSALADGWMAYRVINGFRYGRAP